ncbi:MAG: peroxiredoxin [Chloroflexi bacterium]|nr:MAG: peroxiredoxin [Chloroflexota bacterium]
MLEVGEPMPEFVLFNRKHEPVTNKDFEGKVSILAFYPMAFTGGCTLEMQGFKQRYEELEALGVEVVGVSADPWAAAGAFCDAQELQFQLLSDFPAGQTIDAFGVRREGAATAQRVTFVFDAAGVLRHAIQGTTDMEAHPQGALDAARTLSAGS